MTRYFVDPQGNYLGGYDGPDKTMPVQFGDAVEVPGAPAHAAQKWLGDSWGAAPEPEKATLTVESLADLLVSEGLIPREKVEEKRPARASSEKAP